MKILSLSGFVPEQICDIVRFTQYDGSHTISHYCGYAADFISQVMEDETIDGAVFPKSCDSSRVLSSYLMESGKFLYQIPVPSSSDRAAVSYMATSIRQYQKAIEDFYKISIKDIEKRVERINERNASLKEQYGKLGEGVIYSRYLREIHNLLKTPLLEQQISNIEARKKGDGKRIYLIGSFLSNCRVLESIEKSGMCIVGDNFPESKRLVFAPEVSAMGDIYENIAVSMLHTQLSPTQNRFSELIVNDLAEIKKKDVEGVIYISQKYCEPYDYLYYIYRKRLDEMNIPILKITMSDSTDNKKLDFELEAFCDLM